jgi:nucleoside-triphosphatase THEP1
MINAVLTGAVHIGKTTVCQAIADLVHKRGYCVRGILTPPILDEHGRRLGIDVLDLATTERRVLARVWREGDQAVPAPKGWEAAVEGIFAGPQVGVYQFDRAALQWGQEAVARAIAVGCDLLIVDEIGRLELEHNDGFGNVLELVQTSIVLRSLLVVRFELLEKFGRRMTDFEFITFEVTADNRHTLPFEIAERLFLS